MDIVERLRESGICASDIGCCDEILNQAADEIERLREELEDMHRRERSTAIQQLGNEGQRCDLVAAKDDEIERLREALDILQAAMVEKKPIPMRLKKVILMARSALQQKEGE